MRYTDFIDEYAQRLGLTTAVAQHLVDSMCAEVLRQLRLGEEVSFPKLGKFSTVKPRPVCRVSNLPGMKGKRSLPRAKKRLGFKPYQSANTALMENSILGMLSGVNADTTINSKARREANMAKSKKDDHRVIDVPAGVRQITINLPEEPKRKKRGKGESGTSKERLLG